MRPILVITSVVAAFLLVTSFSFGNKMESLWKKYDDYSKKDLPKEKAEILDRIIAEATQRRLPYDFYKAATSAHENRIDVNWKEREAADSILKAQVSAFDYPIVTYSWMSEFQGASAAEKLSFIKAKRPLMESVRNDDFYRDSEFKTVVGFANDYEYALWDTCNWGNSGFADLKDHWKGRYPGEGYLEYLEACRASDKKGALTALVGKYQDKAIGLFPEAELLWNEYSSLDNHDNSQYSRFESLYSRCLSFEKKRKLFRGSERRIASKELRVEEMLSSLMRKETDVDPDGDSLTVEMRNIYKASLSIYKGKDGKPAGKPVFSRIIEIDGDKPFVWNKVSFGIPDMPDGEYAVRLDAEKSGSMTTFTQYSLSIAYRQDKDGPKVYLTDSKTGKPVEAADMMLFDDDKKIAEETLAVFGFTRLQSIFQKVSSKNRSGLYLQGRYVDGNGYERLSDKLWIHYDSSDNLRTGNAFAACKILTDKSLYKPGETVKYKAICFETGTESGVLERKSIKVVLYDAEHKELEFVNSETNEFGTVSGVFRLPVGRRNGRYQISVSMDGRMIGEESIRVEEYELPSFEIVFDENDKLWKLEDTVLVTGRIITYSGHSLAGASVKATVRNGWREAENAPLKFELKDDGSFKVFFKPSSHNTSVKVTVADPTGETAEGRLSIDIPYRTWVGIIPVNGVPGEFEEGMIIKGDVAVVKFEAGRFKGVPVEYILTDAAGKELSRGSACTGEDISIDLSSYMGDEFILKAGEETLHILRIKEGSRTLYAAVDGVFIDGDSKVEKGGTISMLLGSGKGPVWAVATLYGYEKTVLDMRMVLLKGVPGKDGSLVDVNIDYLDSYPEEVVLHVFYFKDNESFEHSQSYTRVEETPGLSIEYSSFTDKSLPGGKCRFILQTEPMTDVAVSVYDKAIDKLSSGTMWRPVVIKKLHPSASYVVAECGGIMSFSRPMTRGFGMIFGSKAAVADSANMVEDEIVEEVALDYVAFQKRDDMESSSIAIRSDFADALCFLPSLRPDADGKVSFEFNASDKLSTFVVRAFAHDKKVRSAVTSRDMVVSIPVKVSMLEPRFLYVGDMCNIVVNVSADSESPASGDLYLYVYPGKDHENLKPVAVHKKHLDIQAGKAASASFPFNASEVGEIGLKAVFDGGKYSDGMFVSVPVTEPVQTLTESHSKVILPGMDQKAAEKELRSSFVNVSGKDAEVRVVSILDMLTEAMPEEFDPKGDDVISLTSAYIVRKLSSRIVSPREAGDDALLEKIMACRNADGGFCWFAGMKSSEAVTSRVLERFARLRDRGISIPDMTESVKYLDKAHFDGDIPYWRGRLMDASYMYVRSMYPEVEFSRPESKAEKVRFDSFRKFAKHYLSPDAVGDYSARGDIYQKVLRLSVLSNLSSSDSGLDLAKAWGAGLFASYKVSMSMKAEVKSVLEYAVKHDGGGIYYPNAVMPFRGMLEDEAYMHSMICNLLSKTAPESEVADGIRIWLMLQKETQEWKASPAFVETLVTVLDGSESVLSTKVMALSANYSKPFSEIKSAGNGYKISKTYLKVGADGKPVELKGGESLAAGDKIIARYNIWSAENRSFVKLTAPREAAFSPVSQFSGYYWGGYREVRSDCTNYYFDSYPEEKTTIEEEFHVTRRGVFSAPVVSIESFYAPHYRANDKFFGKIVAD